MAEHCSPEMFLERRVLSALGSATSPSKIGEERCEQQVLRIEAEGASGTNQCKTPENAISNKLPSRRFLLWRLMAFSRAIHNLDFDFS
jgi:hypothetical protein